MRVVTGIPSSWDSCVAIAGATSEPHHAVWSPCGQYIAAGSGIDIEVRNSTTLEVSYVLQPPDLEDFYPALLAFSPDGHLLICAYQISGLGLFHFFSISVLIFIPRELAFGGKNSIFVAWDIQTGVLLEGLNDPFELDMGPNRMMLEFSCVVYTFFRGIILDECYEAPPDLNLGPHWTHEGSLYFAAS